MRHLASVAAILLIGVLASAAMGAGSGPQIARPSENIALGKHYTLFPRPNYSLCTDPDDIKKGPIDAVVLDPTTLPSHHGPDVQAVLKGLNIVTMAFKVPTTHMHLHSLILSLRKPATKEDLVAALEAAPRIQLVDGKSGFKSTAAIMDLAREMGRPRNDTYEATVWKDSVTVIDGEAYMFLGVHQEAIFVPENVDAIRALAGVYSREESLKLTDESLGIVHR
jgi:glyceraldehyde-3-phosphate dehydrogenase (NAD(P))